MRNDGSAPLHVSSSSISGAAEGSFSITSGGGAATLSAGSSRTVTVRFAPSSTGAKNASLRVSSDDPDEGLVDVTLQGQGTTVSPSAMRFYNGITCGGSLYTATLSTTGFSWSAFSGTFSGYQSLGGLTRLGPLWTYTGGSCAPLQFNGFMDIPEGRRLRVESSAPGGVITLTFSNEGPINGKTLEKPVIIKKIVVGSS